MTEDAISDDDLIASIAPDVMRCLQAKRFFELLDDMLSPSDQAIEPSSCRGGYAATKRILNELEFDETAISEILDVLARHGGCCDCGILYNIAGGSRLKAKYWSAKGEGSAPPIRHHGGQLG